MVRRRVVSLLDDLDGDTADETVQFTLDGTHYEIDLSLRNAATLRRTLADYVSAARRLGTARREQSPATLHPAGDREQNRTIRAWARRRGMFLRDRGRIPTDVVRAYHHDEVGRPGGEPPPV